MHACMCVYDITRLHCMSRLGEALEGRCVHAGMYVCMHACMCMYDMHACMCMYDIYSVDFDTLARLSKGGAR